MYLDLNLLVDLKDEPAQRAMVSAAFSSGYDGIAFNHVVAGRMMTSADASKHQPVLMGSALAGAAGAAGAERTVQRNGASHSLPSFQQLSRITAVIEDASQASALTTANPMLATYDIVAVQPTNPRTFSQACASLEVDLIVLDLGARRSFRFRQQDVAAALNRGVHFEICYSGLFEDSQARRQLLTNAQALVKMTRGKNIIISSGASQAMDLRTPYDVINLASLFGLNFRHATAAISRRTASVIQRGVTRRSTLRGAVGVKALGTLPLHQPAVEVPQGAKVGEDVTRCFNTSGAATHAMEIDSTPRECSGDAPDRASAGSAGLESGQSTSRVVIGQGGTFRGSPTEAIRAGIGEDGSATAGRLLDGVPQESLKRMRPSLLGPEGSSSLKVIDETDQWIEVQGKKRSGSGSASKQRRKQRNKLMKIQI